MKIIGFTIQKISIEKKNSINEKLKIRSGLNIINIKKEKILISENSALKFDFSYTLDYEPNVAKLEIRGSVITLDDKDESEEILKQWENKKYTHKSKIPLFNFIMGKCNIKAIQLEDEIGLPIHIRMPKLKAKPKEESNSVENTE